jgi:hypothetical protein
MANRLKSKTVAHPDPLPAKSGEREKSHRLAATDFSAAATRSAPMRAFHLP